MRSIVKHSYIRKEPGAAARARAHINYLQFRSVSDRGPGKSGFFTADQQNVSGRTVARAINAAPDRGVLVHKLILSPGSNEIDMEAYTRHVMARLGQAKGLQLQWWAREHTNTDHGHAHVIVMGRDENGARVRFHRSDYTFLREVGDKYIEEHERYYKDLEKDLERLVAEARRRQPTNRELAEQIGSGISKTVRRFFSSGARQDPAWLKRRRESSFQRQRRWLGIRRQQEQHERTTMGQLPVKSKQREPKPSTLVWYRSSTHNPWSRVELSANSPLYALNELKQACEKGVHSLTRKDRLLLDSWIEKKRQQILELNRKARSVGFIDLRVDGEDVRTYGPDNSFEELKALWNAHRRGTVVLRDEEARALAWWLSKKQRDHHRGNLNAETEKRRSR